MAVNGSLQIHSGSTFDLKLDYVYYLPTCSFHQQNKAKGAHK